MWEVPGNTPAMIAAAHFYIVSLFYDQFSCFQIWKSLLSTMDNTTYKIMWEVPENTPAMVAAAQLYIASRFYDQFICL